MPGNENAKTNKGKQDFRRIHFTPLCYRDGDYTVKTYIYDCWTPIGMLSVIKDVNAIEIDGNMYNDWYVNHSAKK